MAHRGTNLFKRNDGVRAMRIARDGGIVPAMIEIVAKDGTTFRVYSDKAASERTQEVVSAREWDAEIAKLKAKTTPKHG